MRNHQLESRVRENRTHGSEGGESVVLFPTPIRKFNELDTGTPRVLPSGRFRRNDGRIVRIR